MMPLLMSLLTQIHKWPYSKVTVTTWRIMLLCFCSDEVRGITTLPGAILVSSKDLRLV